MRCEKESVSLSNGFKYVKYYRFFSNIDKWRVGGNPLVCNRLVWWAQRDAYFGTERASGCGGADIVHLRSTLALCVAAACLQLIPKSGDKCWCEIRSQNAAHSPLACSEKWKSPRNWRSALFRGQRPFGRIVNAEGSCAR